MDKISFDEDGNFIVRESKFINYLLAFFFLAIFFGILITRDFEIGKETGDFYLIYFFFLMGTLLFFVNGTRKGINIIINPAGIFYQGMLVTNWDNFQNAFIRLEEYWVNNNSDGTSDKFKIVIEYFDANRGGNFLYEMPTTSTQDKSEYQIISAISHFSGKNLSYELFN